MNLIFLFLAKLCRLQQFPFQEAHQLERIFFSWFWEVFGHARISASHISIKHKVIPGYWGKLLKWNKQSRFVRKTNSLHGNESYNFLFHWLFLCFFSSFRTTTVNQTFAVGSRSWNFHCCKSISKRYHWPVKVKNQNRSRKTFTTEKICF